MPKSTAKHSCGTKLYYADAPPAPQNWVQIAKVIDINAGNRNVTVTEVPHLESPNCANEKIPGRFDGGDVTWTLNFTPTQAAVIDGLIQNYIMIRIEYPGGSTLDCEGFLSQIGDSIPDNDRITQDVTFAVSGRPIFTPGV